MLTRKDICERFKFHVATLQRLRKAGRFPKPVRLGRRCLRWREEDVERWAKQRRVTDPIMAGGDS